MANIWVVTKHTGGHNAVWPARDELAQRGYNMLDIGHDKAIELLSEKRILHVPAYDSDPELFMDWMMRWTSLPDAYITSTCRGDGLGRNLVPYMQNRAIPTIAVTDYWGGAQNAEFKNTDFWTNAICVQDKLSKEMLLEDWHGYPEARAIKTGQPAFDHLIDIDVREVTDRIRGEADSMYREDEKEWPLVVYAGQPRGNHETLLALARVLNNLPYPVYFAALKHPRYAGGKDLWNIAEREFRNGGLLWGGAYPTDEWAAACDVMVSMTSTVLATAAYFRKECISVLLPEVDKLKELGLPFLPMEKLGACEVARSQSEAETLLTKALSSEGLGLRKNQKKHFVLDGKSASRVADVVEDLL